MGSGWSSEQHSVLKHTLVDNSHGGNLPLSSFGRIFRDLSLLDSRWIYLDGT